jgi:hypothetical protein
MLVDWKMYTAYPWKTEEEYKEQSYVYYVCKVPAWKFWEGIMGNLWKNKQSV